MITPNESLQLNELLVLKSLDLTKSLLMSPMISDPDLKEMMMRDIVQCEDHIKQLKSFMELSSVECIKTHKDLIEDVGGMQMTIISGIAHMAGLNDQVIASDFIISVKSAIQNYSVAIIEVTFSNLRNILKKTA